MSTHFWEQVSECFREDDGSFPGIEITKLSPKGVLAIYAMLRCRSKLAGDKPPELWNRSQQRSVPIDFVPDAAALVVTGDAEAFHFTVRGISVAGVELPVLGVFVWPDCVELDYRMGSDWGPEQIAGFFELLKECCALDSGAIVQPAKFEGPPAPERFSHAWNLFCESGF